MRLLRSIRSVRPEGGGPIEGILRTSAIHRHQGHEVEIVSLDRPADPWLKGFPLPVHALGNGGGKYGFSGEYDTWLRGTRSRYDAVIVSGLWQYHSLGVWRALRGTATPYFVFPHGMLDPWFKRAHPLNHLKKWLYWPWAEYRVLRDARAVLFTCEEERRLARQSFRLYRCTECVVRYGTTGPTNDVEQQKEAFLSAFSGLRNRRLILFLGRLHPKKGCDLLIEAFAAVSKFFQPAPTNPSELHLVIAGPDQSTYAAELKHRVNALGIGGRVTWPGMIAGELKWGAIRAAEVFVLPSHQENFGIAVAEALACSLPVLISNKVNIWREIETDKAGLVGSDDASGTRRLLERWLNLSEPEQGVMRRNALRCFERRFEAQKAAQSLIDAVRPTQGSC
jgi:glycosyltransferase involved in cell wall biosynthesis